VTRWICLLRGVNVLGRCALPMSELARSMERLGLRDVKTYIQSGNVVFSSAARNAAPLVAKIRKAIAVAHGVDPHVLLLTQAELEDAAGENPFPEAAAHPKSVHLFFLDRKPSKPDVTKLHAQRADSERFLLADRVFYLHTPDGFGISKLARIAERALGVPATARNWRTVTALIAMARETA